MRSVARVLCLSGLGRRIGRAGRTAGSRLRTRTRQQCSGLKKKIGRSGKWSDEETDDPLYADDRNFYKVELWTKDEQQIQRMLFAGSNLDKARAILVEFIRKRPRAQLTIRQRTRVLQKWPEKPLMKSRAVRAAAVTLISKLGGTLGSGVLLVLSGAARLYFTALLTRALAPSASAPIAAALGVPCLSSTR